MFYNLLCETIFQAFLHVFFIFFPSSLQWQTAIGGEIKRNRDVHNCLGSR
jgi:hypothetical protein